MYGCLGFFCVVHALSFVSISHLIGWKHRLQTILNSTQFVGMLRYHFCWVESSYLFLW